MKQSCFTASADVDEKTNIDYEQKNIPTHSVKSLIHVIFCFCHLTYLIKLSHTLAFFLFHTCLFLFPSLPPSLNYKQRIEITDKDRYNFLYTGEFLLTVQTQKVVFKVITNTYTRTHTCMQKGRFSFLCLSDKTIPSGQIFSSGRKSMQMGLEGHSNTHNHNKTHTHTHILVFFHTEAT